MNLAQRYLFRRLLAALLVAFPALALAIWASQALRQLGLVTEQGQGLGVFLEAAILLLPGLVTIIAPITLLIAVIYTLNGLNTDSELVGLSAGGASPALLIAPVLLVAVPVALIVAASTLVLAPVALRGTNLLVADVNADLVSTVISPGQFRTLERDVTIHVAGRRADGALENLFVFDQRDAEETVAYLAAQGGTFQGPGGTLLLMSDGLVQRRDRTSGVLRVIEFDQYVLNLSSFLAETDATELTPSERDTAYLLDPDASDPIFQDNPYRYRGELNSRIIKPLYAIALVLIPTAILGYPHSARRSRGGFVAVTGLLGGGLMALGLFLDSAVQTNPQAGVIGYALPLAGIALPLALMISGRSVRLPRRFLSPRRAAPPRQTTGAA